MKSPARLYLGLLTIASVLAFVSCSGDDDDDTTGGGGQGNAGEAAEPVGGHGHVGGEAHGGGGHAETPAICQVLGRLCHDADTGTGPAADCHELGHVGDLEVCEQEFAGCIGTCVTSGGGEGGAGAGGAAGETPDPYCAALGSLCHPVDLGTGMGADCHEIGHVGNAADCAESFDACATFCLAELDKLEEAAGGAGGAGGAAPVSGGAGGAP